jgi:hypothetical protein
MKKCKVNKKSIKMKNIQIEKIDQIKFNEVNSIKMIKSSTKKKIFQVNIYQNSNQLIKFITIKIQIHLKWIQIQKFLINPQI